MFLSTQNKIRWRLLCFACVVVLALIFAGIYWFDEPLFMWFRNFNYSIFKYVGDLFDAANWLLVFGGLTVFVYMKKVIKAGNVKFNKWFNIKNFLLNMKTTNVFLIFCAVLSASVIGEFFKVCIGRYRPVFYEALGITGFNPFSVDWAFNSMPSGHTLAAFAGLVMVGMLKPKYKWLTWTCAIIIGLSRIAVGAHWPTDVIFGAFIGMVTADFVLSYARK
ncbi:MAG: phosphatase PAP2 family protein [Proteobacteria bacterium]|nr:phosphatase PAP2 family protein [Candidatus Enterousia scatequi]